MRGVGLLILIMVIIGIVFLGFRIHRTTEDRAWRRAEREALWVPATREVNGRTEFYIHRTVTLGDRTEKLNEQHVSWLDAVGQSETEWAAQHSEAWGKAEFVASVRNATG